MADMFGLFKVIIILQLFYAFSITILAYTVPADAQTVIDDYAKVGESIDLYTVSDKIQDSLNQQRTLPLIELGALVFYSGNILLDLFLNFAFALPQMLALLIKGMMYFLNIDTFLWGMVQIFASVVVSALYLLGIIQLLTQVRSGVIQ